MLWHPMNKTIPTNEEMLAVIEATGKEFASKAKPSYWPCEEMRRAEYFKDTLPGLRRLYRACQSGDRNAVCRIFRQVFRNNVWESRKLEKAIAAWS